MHNQERLIKREIVRVKHFVSKKWRDELSPDLLGTQKESFQNFLSTTNTVCPYSLSKILKSAFPMVDGNNKIKIEYLSHEIHAPEFSPKQCEDRDMTYASKLMLNLKFTVKVSSVNENEEKKEKIDKQDFNFKDKDKNLIEVVKTELFFVGYLPIQTDQAKFIINGNRRMIVSQTKRCPGIFLCREYMDIDKIHHFYVVKIIPNRGSWLEVYVDNKNIIMIKIDRKKKLPFTTFLMCFAEQNNEILSDTDNILDYYTKAKILKSFYPTFHIEFSKKKHTLKVPLSSCLLSGKIFSYTFEDEKGTVIFPANQIIDAQDVIFSQNISYVYTSVENICHFISAQDMFNLNTGEIYFEAGDNFSNFFINFLKTQNLDTSYEVLGISDIPEDQYVLNTIRLEKNNTRKEALTTWGKLMKHSEYSGVSGLNHYFHNSYMNNKLYDMSVIGRKRCIQKFQKNLLSQKESDFYQNNTDTYLMHLDIINMVHNLIAMYKKQIVEDDPDSYVNRHVRTVGELVSSQVKLGLEKVAKKLSNRNTFTDSVLLKGDFFNIKAILHEVYSFFKVGCFSQYLAEENPLSTICHARKCTVKMLIAPMNTRDVIQDQYSFKCFKETPEGINIGLVTNLTAYAKVDHDGFLISIFAVVRNGIITNESVWLNVFEVSQKIMVSRYVFALNNDNQLELQDQFLMCRYQNNYILKSKLDVEITEISMGQGLSVAANLAVYSDKSDGYRTTLASNMMKQAVSPFKSQAPLVGTGMEKYVGAQSGEVIIAKESGRVCLVDSHTIAIESINEKNIPNITLYRLTKFERSNQDTCINHRVIVKIGDYVHKGTIIADSNSTYKGEIALGRNLYVAYYNNKENFEDAVKINESVVKNGAFSNLSIYEFKISVKDTRSGMEEITRDLPDTHSMELKHLDENGIVEIGSFVKPGDILVGKVTPLENKENDPKQKLLQAIFLTKAQIYRKTPLVVPPSISGIVTKISIFTKAGIELSGSALSNLKIELDRKKNTFIHSKNIFINFLKKEIFTLILQKKITESVGGIKKNTIIVEDLREHFNHLSLENLLLVKTNNDIINTQIETLTKNINEQIFILDKQYQKESKDLYLEHKFSDDSTLICVKVYITELAPIEVGDKMANRHGNKGVISKIDHRVDMPYLEDGTIIDLVLNPSSIIARMNLGQLFEVLTNILEKKLRSCINKFLNQYLQSPQKENLIELQKVIIDAVGEEKIGNFFVNAKEDLTIYELTAQETVQLAHKFSDGIYFLAPLYETVSLEEMQNLLKKHDLPIDGKMRIFDGKTSEPLEDLVLVGNQYFLALTHMARKKIHARSIGPYLKHTKQPTHGKKNSGGQKCGEMENWANIAHGSAFICQEVSIKSDDEKKRKECFLKQCNMTPISLLVDDLKQELRVLQKLKDNPQNVEISDFTGPSFDLVEEELYACCFKKVPKVIINVIEEENGEDKTKEDMDDIIIDKIIDIENLEELEEQNIKDKIRIYKNNKIPQYEKIISFALVSPEDILKTSNGEVLNTETLNYRTNTPEKNGLFCEAIFGPINNYECACKKYSQKKYHRIVCDKCGVTVLHSSARRKRRGHIQLAYPMIHPFYLRSTNNKICMLLDISYKDLTLINSFEKYIVIHPNYHDLKYKQILSLDETNKLKKNINLLEISSVIETGAKALRTLLAQINFDNEKIKLKDLIAKTNSELTKKHLVQNLSILSRLQINQIRPEWMILQYLPVLPANLRQITEIAPHEFASSDLNNLYKEIIGRNNRLKILKEYDMTMTMIENEQRMLQQSVIALIGNTSTGSKGTTPGKTSLSLSLQGKTGRFRQNLLGKRVDYSGRAVIVVAPDLKMDECYVSRDILLVLYQQLLYSVLKQYGIVNTWQDSQKILENSEHHSKIWDILSELVKNDYCILNRAPSLHRLSMQAFKIRPWCHKVIGISPLVCSAFNADFDGDQMAIHLPLSIEGQLEAEILMCSTKNILSATNGQLVIGPRQDITIGIFTLTMLSGNAQNRNELLTFFNIHEVRQALLIGIIKIREEILFYHNQNIHETTVGRVLFWDIVPKNEHITFALINKPITDKVANNLLKIVRKYLGDEETVNFAENIKNLGFEYAEKFGNSISLNDFPQIHNIHQLKKNAQAKQIDYELNYREGLITQQDKDKKIYQIWTDVIQSIKKELEVMIKDNKSNPVFLSIESGARGSLLQLMQIIGIKGFVSRVDGSVHGSVIQGNYLEGLNPLEAFDAQTAARTVGSNTSLKTAASGYITRKLVDVAHSVVINMHNCNTQEGITVNHVIRNGQIQTKLSDQLLGRVLLEDMIHPITKEILFPKNHFIKDESLQIIDEIGIIRCKIRSPITCTSQNGVCVHCYGSDLSTGELVVLGEAVGIIAAQSIGEPGSQLTLKSKSFGGVAQYDITTTKTTCAFIGKIQYKKIKIIDINNKKIVFSRGGKVLIVNELGHELIEYIIPYGATILKENNKYVEIGDIIAEWEIHTPILSEYKGICKYENIIDKITCDAFFDDTLGKTFKIIKSDTSNKNILTPSLVIYAHDNPEDELARYVLEEHTIVKVEDNEKVLIGTILGTTQKNLEKLDIVGGLPKVSAFLENRQPKIASMLSPFDGTVDIKKDTRGRTKVLITNEQNKNEIVEYVFSNKNNKVIVHIGDYVEKGDEITQGTPLLNDILNIKGIDEFFKYFHENIKQIYEDQGIFIKNIHFEIIASKLLSKVIILDNGDSEEYVSGEIAEYCDVLNSNKTLVNLVKFKRHFMGLTAIALSTPSILSAMSFQGTTMVLADSIIKSNKLSKLGFKEDLMLGSLPSLGTGFIVRRLINNILYSMDQYNTNLMIKEEPVADTQDIPVEDSIISDLNSFEEGISL
jgi:DNA-directed RNA polymerase subunit beta-beta'